MHRGHGEGQYGASRGVRSGLVRSAKILLLSVLARPPCSSVLKNFLPYFGPAARTGIGGSRPANAKRAACREATHDERSWRKLAQIKVLYPRGPRGFLRLAVQSPPISKP
jgi:hypothetical protein